MSQAFAGAQAVYAMIPPNPALPNVLDYEENVGETLASAIEKNRIPHVVMLSSFGADKPDKTGPVLGLHRLEERLGQIRGLNVLCLRAGYFMTNLLPQAQVIQSFGMMAGPVRADLPLPLIATRDIGAAAAQALIQLDFQGRRTRELQGARNVTYTEAARLIGAAIGKPGLNYQQMPGAQLKPALTQMGMSANFVDLLLEMADALNTGYMKTLEPRTAENTTPTTIETFIAEEFVPAYRGAAAHA
jgi:uncharacterized protein YbjT (DUF2867 family)